MPESTLDVQNFAALLKDALGKAQAAAASLRRTNLALLLTSIISSALVTLVTGWTAAAGPLVGQGLDGWRLACVIGAILGLVSTISAGAFQQLRIGERLAESGQCLGRLRAIETALALGSRPPAELAKEYEEIVRTFAAVLH